MRPNDEHLEPRIAEFDGLRRSLKPIEGLGAPWLVAGGWALDLFLGRVTRAHGDVDLALLRRDQDAVRRHFAGWSLRWVEPWPGGAFRAWKDDDWLALPVHEVHGANDAGATIELLLNEARGDVWHFRRNVSISRPLPLVGRTSPRGLPYLAPEIVLLCKYKAEDPRPSDEADLASVRDRLEHEQRSWLSRAITASYGDHPWLALL